MNMETHGIEDGLLLHYLGMASHSGTADMAMPALLSFAQILLDEEFASSDQFNIGIWR